MAFYLTQLGGDNFQYANVSPLPNPPWTPLPPDYASNALQVVDELCEPTKVYPPCSELFTGVSLPDDQYASATFVNLGFNDDYSGGLYVRSVPDTTMSFIFVGYSVAVANLGAGC